MCLTRVWFLYYNSNCCTAGLVHRLFRKKMLQKLCACAITYKLWFFSESSAMITKAFSWQCVKTINKIYGNKLYILKQTFKTTRTMQVHFRILSWRFRKNYSNFLQLGHWLWFTCYGVQCLPVSEFSYIFHNNFASVKYNFPNYHFSRQVFKCFKCQI